MSCGKTRTRILSSLLMLTAQAYQQVWWYHGWLPGQQATT